MAWKMHFSSWQGQRSWCQAENLHKETNLLEVMIILSHTHPKSPLKQQEKTTLRKKSCVARVKHRSYRPLKFNWFFTTSVFNVRSSDSFRSPSGHFSLIPCAEHTSILALALTLLPNIISANNFKYKRASH